MIDSPVLQLQEKAASVSVDLQELLLRGKMIALKLDLEKAVEFFENELNGYKGDKVPHYRSLSKVSIQGFNRSSNLWSRIEPSDLYNRGSLEYDLFSLNEKVHFKNSISMLQRYAGVKDENYYFDLSPSVFDEVTAFNANNYTRVCNVIPVAKFNAMLTKIRTKTLDWACWLEKEGILGEGLQFTSIEKREAQIVTYNNTINNTGNGMTMIGDVDSKNSVVGGTVSNVNQQNISGDLSALERQLDDFGYNETDIQQLKNLIAEVPAPTNEKEVFKKFRGWISDMTEKAFDGGMKITGEAATGVLTKLISQYFGIDM